METVELMLDERNELTFKLSVQGSSIEKIRTRLVCEASEIAYSFDGNYKNDMLTVSIPPMSNSINEGTYQGKLEVIVDGRLIVPLEFPILYKKKTAVIAEVVKAPLSHGVSITAKIEKPSQQNVKIESKNSPISKQTDIEAVRRMIHQIIRDN